jgi:hypothetical protein
LIRGAGIDFNIFAIDGGTDDWLKLAMSLAMHDILEEGKDANVCVSELAQLGGWHSETGSLKVVLLSAMQMGQGVSIYHVSNPFITDVARCSWPRVQADRWIDKDSKVCDLVQKYASAFLDSVEIMGSEITDDDHYHALEEAKKQYPVSIVSPYGQVTSHRLAIAQFHKTSCDTWQTMRIRGLRLCRP